MKPGATIRPAESMMKSFLKSDNFPTLLIFPPEMPISPLYQGFPDPSTIFPFSMTMSYVKFVQEKFVTFADLYASLVQTCQGKYPKF